VEDLEKSFAGSLIESSTIQQQNFPRVSLRTFRIIHPQPPNQLTVTEKTLSVNLRSFVLIKTSCSLVKLKIVIILANFIIKLRRGINERRLKSFFFLELLTHKV
jgi:hypothetical protein